MTIFVTPVCCLGLLSLLIVLCSMVPPPYFWTALATLLLAQAVVAPKTVISFRLLSAYFSNPLTQEANATVEKDYDQFKAS